MAMEINTVLNKDCMEGMAVMADGSVDLVIADPPYYKQQIQHMEVLNRIANHEFAGELREIVEALIPLRPRGNRELFKGNLDVWCLQGFPQRGFEGRFA